MVKFLKFAVTGGLGTVTNLALFFIFADVLHLPSVPVSAGCFFVAATQNYFLNHLWTFREENAARPVSFLLWLKFISGSLAGLFANVAVLALLTHFFAWSYKVIPQAAGILFGTGVNFVFANFFVFREK